MSFRAGDSTPGRLLSSLSPSTLPQIDMTAAAAVELMPARSRIREALCRGCARCVDVCPFQAIVVSSGEDSQPQARIESALCRGCNLCTAVCPTYASVSEAFSPGWWRARLENLFDAAESRSPRAQPYVVLACQRRAGGLENFFDENEIRVEIIGLRCLGQIDAGMLLELCRGGARGVVVAGCHVDRCRFQRGSRMAAEQVERARSMLRLVGADEHCILVDWSKTRVHDPLQALVRNLIARAQSADGRRVVRVVSGTE
jgi:coenzyme F420-reducing hydrogenase delta subunit/ferredoxin